MNKLLKYMVMLSMVMAMTSCGTVGLLIHTARIVNDIQSFSVNSACDTIRFVVNKKNQMLLKAEINGNLDTVMYDSGVNSFALLMYTPSTKPEGMKFYNHRISGADGGGGWSRCGQFRPGATHLSKGVIFVAA